MSKTADNLINWSKISRAGSVRWSCWMAMGLVSLNYSKWACAQSSFGQLESTLTNVMTLLQGAGVTVVTVAIAWAGYKMIFQHARWADVATIVLGGVLIGGAGAAAKWLVG